MLNKLKKFVNDCRNNNHGPLLKDIGEFIYSFKNKLGLRSQITSRRIKLSSKINEMFNGEVRYGPFKGLKLSNESWWGETDRANMLLGIYEQEVLNSINSVPKKYTNFIDIGAANGYYGVGVLVSNIFKKSYCYEISAKGQSTILTNAKLNNVCNRIEVRGIATSEFYNDIPQNELDRSVLFVDIEGAEFDLLNSRTLEKFRNSVLLVEAHPWAVRDGDAKLEKLKQMASEFFRIQELTTTSRDLSVFEELKGMDDTDRWLICSEGRPCMMTWLRMDPLEEDNKP